MYICGYSEGLNQLELTPFALHNNEGRKCMGKVDTNELKVMKQSEGLVPQECEGELKE